MEPEVHLKQEAEDPLEMLRSIPTLRPWMHVEFEGHMATPEATAMFRQRLQSEIDQHVMVLYRGMAEKTSVRNQQALLDTQTNATRLANQLLVQLKRRVVIEDITEKVSNGA